MVVNRKLFVTTASERVESNLAEDNLWHFMV